MKWIRFGKHIINLDNVKSILIDKTFIHFNFSERNYIAFGRPDLSEGEWNALYRFVTMKLECYVI